MKENLINITEETIISQLTDILKSPKEYLEKIEGLDVAEIDYKLYDINDLWILWYIDPNVISRRYESAAILLSLFNIFHAIQFFVSEEKKMSQLYSSVYLKTKEYAEKNEFKIFPLITEQYSQSLKAKNGL